MKIKLVLFEDCSLFDSETEQQLIAQNDSSLMWTLEIDGVEVGKLDTYENMIKKIDVMLDIEEKFKLINK